MLTEKTLGCAEVHLTDESIVRLVEALRTATKMPDAASSLLTIDKVAEQLHLSVRSVEELISRGDLTPVRFGRARRFTREQVDALIRSAARIGRRR